jgi:serine protease Do
LIAFDNVGLRYGHGPEILKDEAEQPTPPADVEEQEPEATSSDIGISVMSNADGEGLVVESVDPNGPAAGRGIAAGDVIEQANGGAVSAPEDLDAAIDAAAHATQNDVENRA